MIKISIYLQIVAIILFVISAVKATPVQKWHKLGDSQPIYIETEKKFKWHKAWNECAMKNMSLITINSLEKSETLTALLKKLHGKPINIWLGGNDLAEEGTFVWAATGKRFEFTNWYKANPDNYNNNENCVHIYENTNFEWNDANCINSMGFICEENQLLQALRSEWELKKQVIDRLFEL